MKRAVAVINAVIVFAAGVLCHSTTYAQSYPNKPIRLIVPFAPGGTTDILARMVAQKLGSTFAQNVIVDNRGGAGGRIGTELAARAEADGYTIAIGHVGTLTINPTLYRNLSYDPVKDFAAISLIARMPNVLVVANALSVRSVKDLITTARAKPNDILYGSAGSGSTTHLGVVYLEMLANVKLRHIPYKGAGPAITDLLGGNISVMIPGVLPVMPHIKSGRLRLLAVSTRSRLPIFPDVPTIAEAGVPGYEFTNWIGVVGPAGIPRAIVLRLNSEIANALGQPDFKQRLAVEGGEPASSSPAEFGAQIKAEIARWAPVVKASGARVE